MPAPKRVCGAQSGTSVTSMDSSASTGESNLHADILSDQQVKPPGNLPYNFSGMELQDLLVVEICAGTARLTKTVRKRGLRGLAIDNLIRQRTVDAAQKSWSLILQWNKMFCFFCRS